MKIIEKIRVSPIIAGAGIGPEFVAVCEYGGFGV